MTLIEYTESPVMGGIGCSSGSGTLVHDPGEFFNRFTSFIQNLVKFHVDVATIVKNLKHRGQVCIRQGLTGLPELESHRIRLLRCVADGSPLHFLTIPRPQTPYSIG